MISIESMTKLVERAARPGVLGVAGKKVEKNCAKDLRAYFKDLSGRIDKANIGELASYSKEAATHALELKLRNPLRLSGAGLALILSSNIYNAMFVADKQDVLHELPLVNKWRAEYGLKRLKEADPPVDLTKPGPDKLGLTGQEAADYAAKHAAELVTQINETTRKQIADAVSVGIEDQLGVPGLSRLIKGLMADMESFRADMIASTEMNDAMSEAQLMKMQRLQVEYKQVILSDDACETCQENADADPLPIDELYPSGDLRAPFHPNCRCATTGARGPDAESD